MMPANRYEELRRELDANQFMQQARDESGLWDYGNEGFVKPLNKFLDCIARDLNYHAIGLNIIKDDIVRKLVNRLRFQNDLRRHPEILNENVSDPIILFGLPRSGTTKTQRMMGMDPNLLKTFTWELLNPAPFPDAAPGRPDPRIAAASGTDFVAEDIPDLHVSHHRGAEQIEEDWLLFEHTWNDWFAFTQNTSRSLHDWLMSREEPPDIENYLYVRSLFQYLQWQKGGKLNRRWLMKNTGHLAHMEELLETFPKATLVHIHRHPALCLPSLAKVMVDVGKSRLADIDLYSLGASVLEWERISIERYLKARDHLQLNDRIFDVSYEQIRSDPMPVFKEIYRRADCDLTLDAEQRMLQWEKENEQGKHGKHVYSLEEFGLSEAMINEAFGEYIRRFIVE